MKDLQSIRDAIDKIDTEILQLISQRQRIVKSAAQFKNCIEGDSGVIVPKRINSMLISIKQQAKELNIQEDFAEKWFSDLIDYCISLELEEWDIIANNKSK
ncbi:MAG: chorismate mutase [Arcobacteraceae bacterium]